MRQTIKPKLRFQVFTRDEFTCQYCGRRPDQDEVVLQVDHTVSVKDGGTNDIENLVTSCFDCNIGKGAKSILKRTRTEEDLNEEIDLAKERLEQIKALNKRKKSLAKVKEKISVEETRWARDITEDSFSEAGYQEIQKFCKKSGYTPIVLDEALEIAYKKYQKGEIQELDKFIAYLSGVARNISLTPEEQQIILSYNKEVFKYDRMYPQTRKMILDHCDFGIEFHEEVIQNISRFLETKHGTTYKTREAVAPYWKQESFTVYKSGIGLQILVCDTIALSVEELNDPF